MNNYFKTILALVLIVAFSSMSGQAQRRNRAQRAARTAVVTNKPKTVAKVESKPEPPKYRYISLDSVDYNTAGYNALSVFPIHYSQIMYRMKVRRRIDLKEKCNQPFFNDGFELSKYLMDGVKQGKLTAFAFDTVNKVIPLEEVTKELSFKDDLDTTLTNYIKPGQLNIVDIYEDVIFDRQRSMTTYDIQHLVLYRPGGTKPSVDYDYPLFAVRYKDLEAYWATLPLNARWKNPFNNKEDRTFSEAFRLRLFCGRITRLQRDNARSLNISDLPEVGGNTAKALLLSQQYDYDLVSQENELYEY